MSIGPKMQLLEEYALVARALSAPARLLILEQLAQSESGVEALANKAGLGVANCSQHLQQLRRAGLVTSRRQGKEMIYRMNDDAALTVMEDLQRLASRNIAEVDRILRGLGNGADTPEPVSRAELAARLKSGAVTVLDIRPADEFAKGHIPGAINVPMDDLETLMPDLSAPSEIVAYCRGPYCVFAHQAVAALRRRGLNARTMSGGFPEWRADGRQISYA